MHPNRRRTTTAAPIVCSRQRAAYRIGDVAGAVWLDESAESGLAFRSGHGCMVGDSEKIAMPNFLSMGGGGSKDSMGGGVGGGR